MVLADQPASLAWPNKPMVATAPNGLNEYAPGSPRRQTGQPLKRLQPGIGTYRRRVVTALDGMVNNPATRWNRFWVIGALGGGVLPALLLNSHGGELTPLGPGDHFQQRTRGRDDDG